MPLKILNEVKDEFIVVRKKRLTKYGGQVVKQVSKLERIFKCPASLKPITWDKSQHNGIGSHLFLFEFATW